MFYSSVCYFIFLKTCFFYSDTIPIENREETLPCENSVADTLSLEITSPFSPDMSSDTESELSLSDSTDSSEDEDEDVLTQTRIKRVRTRGGSSGVRTRGGSNAERTRGDMAKTDDVSKEWVTWESAPFSPNIPAFTEASGPLITLPVTVKDYVELFLTDELMDNIVEQTNLYAAQFISKQDTLPARSRVNGWKQVVQDDIRRYIGLTILMGLNSLPSIHDHWSTNVLYYNPVYSAVMSRNRYQIISKFIHFANNLEFNQNDPNRDRLFKIRPLLTYLLNKFQEVYYPTMKVSIDEQLLLHKGNLHFKQYIPNKRARFGIKFFSICDQNGYLYNTEVYVGKNNDKDRQLTNEEKAMGKSGQVILRLMTGLLDKGHHLYVDNWYTSVPLFKHLSEKQTPCCGTIRKNRGKFPSTFTNMKLPRGQTLHLVKENILAIRYHDKRDVFFLTTIHRPKLVATKKKDKEGNEIMKQQAIDDYNQSMGFVDRNDAITSQHNMVRKCRKWTTKIVFHMLEESLLNAHILYGLSTNPPMNFTDFKRKYVETILVEIPKVKAIEGSSKPQLNNQKHYLRHVPTIRLDVPSRMKRCKRCYEKGIQKRSRYECDSCIGNPGLCVSPCFKEYHEGL